MPIADQVQRSPLNLRLFAPWRKPPWPRTNGKGTPPSYEVSKVPIEFDRLCRLAWLARLESS